MAQMGMDTLKANLTNPARVYLWEMLIMNPLGGGDEEALSVRCQSTSVPGKSFGEIPIPFRQTAGIRIHGKETYPHTIVLTILEGEDKRIFDAIHQWHQRIVHNRTGQGLPDDEIKRELILNMLRTGGDHWMNIKLIGAWPSLIADEALAYDAEAVITYDVTFTYDRWEEMV